MKYGVIKYGVIKYGVIKYCAMKSCRQQPVVMSVINCLHGGARLESAVRY